MSGNLDLWLLATEDGSLRRLTDDAADDYDPACTSGGKSIVWSSKRINDNYEIWMANADGSGSRQVSRDGFDAENPTGTGRRSAQQDCDLGSDCGTGATLERAPAT